MSYYRSRSPWRPQGQRSRGLRRSPARQMDCRYRIQLSMSRKASLSRSRSPLTKKYFEPTCSSSKDSESLNGVNCVVKEFINDESGILEFTQKLDRSHCPCVYFHSSAYVSSSEENKCHSNLKAFLSLGDIVKVNTKKTNHPALEYLALAVWPIKSDSFSTSSTSKEEELESHFASFLDLLSVRVNFVPASILTISGPKFAETIGRIWEIKNKDFGIIEIRGLKPGRFFALFHKESLVLKNKKNVMALEDFKDKNLNELVTIGDEVNLSARSIIKTKGNQLRPSMLELQAIVVCLDPSFMPYTVPRPTRLPGSPGALGFSPKFTPYFFNTTLHSHLNLRLTEFISLTGKRDPELDESCLEVYKSSSLWTVYKILSESSGVLRRGPDFCVFSWSSVLTHTSSDTFDSLCQLGKEFQVHSLQMDDSQPISYLALLLWDSLETPSEHLNSSSSLSFISSELVSLYQLANHVWEQDSLPASIESGTGKVICILDDNFGVIQWNERKDALVLFDTCDLLNNTDAEESLVHKSLEKFLQTKSSVIFHGVLIDLHTKIPYLASSVWKPDVVSNKFPEFISRDKIHEDKIDIYRVVKKTFMPKVFSSSFGVIKFSYPDSSLIEFKKRDEKFYVLTLESSLTPGTKVSFDYIKMKDGIWSRDIPYIAYNVFVFDDENSKKKTYSCGINFEKALKILSRIYSPNLFESTESNSNSAKFVCMIDENSGVLRHNVHHRQLCYFEREDLNLEDGKEISLLHLIQILSHPDVVLAYQGTKPIASSSSSHLVQYISNVKGVQIHGNLPHPVKKIKSDKSFIISSSRDKVERWENANKAYKEDNVLSLDKVLQKSFPESIVKSSGVISQILNKTTGVVLDVKSKCLSIFDTCDTYVAKDRTAAEACLTVENVFDLGMEVEYNALLVDYKSSFPYLVTQIWRSNSDFVVHSLTNKVGGISRDKIEKYKMSVKSLSSSYLPKTNINHDKENDSESIKKHSSSLSSSSSSSSSSYCSSSKRLKKDSTDSNSSLTGILYCIIDYNFAILKLSNGSKALVHRNRIWLSDHPFSSRNWNVLNHLTSRLIVIGRRMSDSSSSTFDFEYQVIFCHTNSEKLNDINSAWIQEQNNDKKMDSELHSYELQFGNKSY